MPSSTPSEGVLRIVGASQNNLKEIDVDLPLNSLTVISGVSGSGKSSLAFDTLYAEGQRRYVESMSAYARQFLERIQKPAVREIQGISPAIAIRQKNTTRNPRSTVGTVTEIYDFMRLLYARVGTVHCRECGREVRRDTVDQVVESLLNQFADRRCYLTFPFADSSLDLSSDSKGKGLKLRDLTDNLIKQGFHRLMQQQPAAARILQLPASAPQSLEELRDTEVLVDRLVIRQDNRDRITDSLELAFAEGNGIARVEILAASEQAGKSLRFSERFECQHCGIDYRPPDPRLFSFNNPWGACPTCHGFGNTISIDSDLVIPDPSLSLKEGAVEPFTKPRYRRFQRKLLDWARDKGIPEDLPYQDLSESVRQRVWNGDQNYPGVRGLFSYLSRKKYKMHVRIFLSRYRGYSRCIDCGGERLRREARDVYLGGRRISQLTQLPVSELRQFFRSLELTTEQQAIATKLLTEIQSRLEFLDQVGLDYLTLDRITSTLSGGEMQRIHLAASLGSSLSGALYVLDEPSVGLHPRDQHRLVKILKRLRDLGNTIVVVEHEREIIQAADHIVDIGPGAGELGGRILHSGNLESLLRSQESITGRYLRAEAGIPVPVYRRKSKHGKLTLEGVWRHNLKDLDLSIPLGLMVCITGVSGSGKSTLVHDVIYAGIKKLRGEWNGEVARFRHFQGWEQLTDVLLVDQTPIGKTPRSNPVTYIKAFDEIRKLFASLRESQARNLSPAHFSFNVSGGRCEMCQGSGTITVEMQFLADVELVCEECKGKRYKPTVLEVTYKGKNIDDVLNMTVREAIGFFKSVAPLTRKLKVLQEVGLGYLRLGQSATTLSGGEAQRIKLAAYLTRKTKGHPLFIFDEPTTGLHFDDIGKLLRAFDRLIDSGASLIVIEHNLDVIKCADWVIDLGPEGGRAGGELVAEGTPNQVAMAAGSHTGRFLRPYLSGEESFSEADQRETDVPSAHAGLTESG